MTTSSHELGKMATNQHDAGVTNIQIQPLLFQNSDLIPQQAATVNLFQPGREALADKGFGSQVDVCRSVGVTTG